MTGGLAGQEDAERIRQEKLGWSLLTVLQEERLDGRFPAPVLYRAGRKLWHGVVFGGWTQTTRFWASGSGSSPVCSASSLPLRNGSLSSSLVRRALPRAHLVCEGSMGWWKSSQLTPEGPAVAVFFVLGVGKPSPPPELRKDAFCRPVGAVEWVRFDCTCWVTLWLGSPLTSWRLSSSSVKQGFEPRL